EVQGPRHEDPGEGQRLIVTGAALDRQHRPDERERRSEVARDLAAGPCEENQGGDPAEEEHRVDVEAKDERDENSGSEHRHDVLDAEQDGLKPGQTIFGIIDGVLLTGSDGRGHIPLLWARCDVTYKRTRGFPAPGFWLRQALNPFAPVPCP